MERSPNPTEYAAKKYHRVWAAYWLSLIAFVAVVIAKIELAIFPALVAFIFAVVSLLWRCPVCGKRVGCKTYGPFVLGLPGARRCVHCSTVLVSFAS
jgi:hypothetical protein